RGAGPGRDGGRRARCPPRRADGARRHCPRCRGGAPMTSDNINGTTEQDAAELARLAALDLLSYEREREGAAKQLGLRVGALDKLVEALRPKPETAAARGVSLAQIEPWPEPVAGAALLDALTRTIRKHVILPASAADATALWIAHT